MTHSTSSGQGEQPAPQLPEEPGPHDWGLPEKPTVMELKRWQAQERFLKAFSETHRLCDSAAAAGVSPQAVEHWKNEGDYSGRSLNSFNFAKRLELASMQYQERLDAEIDRRAVEGTDHPIIYKGQVTGTYKEYSDNLLMFRRKKLDPSYRDNHEVRVDARQYVTQITINPPGSSTQIPEGQVVEALEPPNNKEAQAPEEGTPE